MGVYHDECILREREILTNLGRVWPEMLAQLTRWLEAGHHVPVRYHERPEMHYRKI